MQEECKCLFNRPWGPVMLRLSSSTASSDMKPPSVSVGLKKQRIVSEGLNHHRRCANTLAVKHIHTNTQVYHDYWRTQLAVSTTALRINTWVCYTIWQDGSHSADRTHSHSAAISVLRARRAATPSAARRGEDGAAAPGDTSRLRRRWMRKRNSRSKESICERWPTENSDFV